MERTIQLVAMALGATMMVLLTGGCSGGSYSVSVPDVGKAWSREFKSGSPVVTNGLLAVRIRGELDGAASVTIAGTKHTIASGRVDRILSMPEYWGDSCMIAYRPESSTTGQLAFDVVVGGRSPSWVLKHPVGTEPLEYTGGWTTWHPDGVTKCSNGFYRHGKKDGEFTYWNQQGNLLRTETWNDGRMAGE